MASRYLFQASGVALASPNMRVENTGRLAGMVSYSKLRISTVTTS
jgi:hypothetical protein